MSDQPSTLNDQLTLITGESDEAMFLPQEELKKRYTGATVEKIELKRNYVLDLLGFGLPIEVIAERTHASTRTVKMLGAKYAEVVSSNSLRFAGVLKRMAARWLALADMKAPDAKFGELAVGVGILTQRAGEVEAQAAGMLPPEEGAIDMEQEDAELAKARAVVNQMAVNNGVPGARCQVSGEPPMDTNEHE